MKQFLIIALAIAGTSASSIDQLLQAPAAGSEEDFNEQVSQICLPRNSSNLPDQNAPCNALMAIQLRCIYGSDALEIISGSQDVDTREPRKLPVDTQRTCICSSQHTDMVLGCFACFKEHGSTDPEIGTDPDKVQSFMEDYCDVNKPARDYANAIIELAPEDEEDISSTASSESSAATTFSDPIGNATDVSLYYTPSVTGTPAYMPGIPTPESSGASATYTSTSISDGQIVPTAVANENEAAGSEESGSGSEATGSGTSTESDSGAVQTAMAQVGAAGAVGIVALMAAL